MIVRVLDVVGVAHHGKFTAISPSQQRVMAILAAAGPTGLSADRFAEELWPHDLPSGWLASVRMAISRMRRAVPPDSISTGGRRYALNLAAADVDAWRLLDIEAIDLAALGESLPLLIAGVPYPGMEPSPLLEASKERITAARIRLMDRLGVEHAPSSQVLESARSLLASHPFREDVLGAVAQLHCSAGWGTQAFRLIDVGIDRLETELGLPVSENLRQLANELREYASQRASAREVAEAIPNPTDHPAQIIGNFKAPAAGVDLERRALFQDALAKLDDGGVIVTGESGSGKTVLARQLAHNAHSDGNHIIWLTARQDEVAAYGAIMASLPMLREHFEPLLTGGGTAFQRTSCWTAAIGALRSVVKGRPINLFVDDAQWLDSHSRRFIEFLAAAQHAESLRLTIIGRDDKPSSAWPGFVQRLSRTGMAGVTTTAFEAADLVELIGRHHPQSTSRQRSDLARFLVANKAALPAIAVELIRTTDTATLATNPGALRGDTSIDWGDAVWANAVSPATRRFAGAAAVLGVTFRLNDVAQLAELEIEEAAEAIDDLLDVDLIDATQRLDEFSFTHVLVRGAFEATLDRAARRNLHRSAARFAALRGDIHGQARHLSAAGLTVDNTELVTTLVASARDHKTHGLFREATEAFAFADRVAAEPLSSRALHDFADAIDRGGGDGFSTRRRAFDAAVADGEHDLSVAIARGGATETESPNGEERRVALLKEVDSAQISSAARQSRDVALVRELGLLGRHGEALAVAQRLTETATAPEDALAAWLSAWPSRVGQPPAKWDLLPPSAEQAADSKLRSHLFQVRCVRAHTVGDHAGARRNLQLMLNEPGTNQDPVRGWYAHLLQALVAFIEGDWERHEERAAAAFAHASLHGISHAFSTHAAQLFTLAWVQGSYASLLPILESAAPDVQHSLLAQAALAISLAQTPDRCGEGQLAIADLAKRITAGESPFAAPVATVLASGVNEATGHQVVKLLGSVLEPFAGLATVVGGGVAHLGPASRALAHLAPTQAEKVVLLERAVAESDAWHLRTWSVTCRLDLAEASADDRFVIEAERFARGTNLHSHFGDYFTGSPD